MKKLIALCLSLALLAGLSTVLASAETETDTTIKYGKADLALTLIDPFDETRDLPGFMNWGTGNMGSGRIFLETSSTGLYDIYDVKTEALAANPTLGGHTYVVFAFENLSDGAVKFGFQPDVQHEGASIHGYVSAALAKNNPVKLIYKDGKVEDAVFNSQSAGRDVFNVPYEFEGYIAIPNAAIATEILGTTPVSAEGKLTFDEIGLHVIGDADDATSYVECVITAMYACSELPAYEASEPGAAPETDPATEPVTEPTTEPVTEPTTEPATESVTLPETDPETVPETDPVTAPAEDTNTPDAETDQPTEAPDDGAGCASTLAGTALVLVATVGGARILGKKD